MNRMTSATMVDCGAPALLSVTAWLAKRSPGYVGLGFPDPSAWLLKQAPAARKGPARTPDARAAITLQPSSPRLQAARRDVSQRPDPGQTAVGSNGT